MATKKLNSMNKLSMESTRPPHPRRPYAPPSCHRRPTRIQLAPKKRRGRSEGMMMMIIIMMMIEKPNPISDLIEFMSMNSPNSIIRRRNLKGKIKIKKWRRRRWRWRWWRWWRLNIYKALNVGHVFFSKKKGRNDWKTKRRYEFRVWLVLLFLVLLLFLRDMHRYRAEEREERRK